MKYLPIAFILIVFSCNSGGKYEKAEDAQDAGRQFIRASLDGDYAKARFYLLQDSVNLMLIEQQQRNYRQLGSEERRLQRESTIRPVSIKKIHDSATSYQYFNTYNTKDTTNITILKSNGDWVVDLKSILKQ